MSTWHVALSPNATFQIKDAVFYYNSKSKGLGKRFYQQVANCLKQLNHKANPNQSQIVKSNNPLLIHKTSPFGLAHINK